MSERRMYTIPGGAQKEAKKALEWRKKHKRGGTPVGLNTARTLAKGGQIGIEKVRHIAKYFPRHEVDKKGKGWAPGEDKFPSNGRIAWALWGGDAAQRWASAIVERENKKEATTAGGGAYGFVDNEEQDELNAFKVAHELDPYLGPEFMARVRLDNSGIDRLYKVEVDGQVYVWDGSAWDNMGHVDGDVYSYDKSLDDPGDMVEKTHVIIDPSSAIIISAFLQERPFQPVSLEEIDPEETAIMAEGIFDEDFAIIDRVITAAGETPTEPSGDGEYSPDERSENASEQPRDATGRFVKLGGRTVVAGDQSRGSGVVSRINQNTGKVVVKLDSGKSIEVDAKYLKPESEFDAPTMAPKNISPVDLSGVIGKPRTPQNLPKAHLPGTLPPMTSKDVNKMLTDYSGYVKEMRESYKPLDAADAAEVKERYGVDKFVGEKSTLPAKAGDTGSRLNLNQGGSTSGTKSNSPKGSSSAKPAATTPTKYDKDGKYVVQKNDSLWSIAEKTKGEGQTVEDQWLKILDANKDNLKSGDPDLIFPDERVNVPGQGSSGTKKTSRPADQGTKKTSKAAAPSAQEKIRQVKQDEARKADESKKRQADAQEKIRQAKQDESRAAKPNAQEAMRKDKQDLSRAEAAKAKSSANQDKITKARNADRLDTTAKAKAKAQADARAGMQADKKAISDAEAAKKKAGADQEKLRNARNADRLDTTAKAKAKAQADARAGMQADKKAISDAEAAKNKASKTQDKLTDARNADRADTTARGRQAAEDKVKSGMQSDKKAISDAEAAKNKASSDQEKLRGARNADRADTTSRARQAAEDKVKSGMQGDKKASSVAEARAKAEAKAKSGVQKAKQAESSEVTETLKNKADGKIKDALSEAKKADQPVIKEKQVENARDKFRKQQEFYKQQQEKYGTYRDRVKAAQDRLKGK